MMKRYRISWLSWDGRTSKFLGFVYAHDEVTARIKGRRQFGPFGNNQDIEAVRG